MIAVSSGQARQPAEGVTDIPHANLSVRQVFDGWSEDRTRLGICVANAQALNGIIEAIEGQGSAPAR